MARSSVEVIPHIKRASYKNLEEAFPDIAPGIMPFGARLLVQVRTPKNESEGGIVLVEETRDTELWNTQVAKVISLGSVAFKNRDTLVAWPEGEWCKVGDYVRVPKYGGDRWQVTKDGRTAMFVIVRDLDVVGAVVGDPLEIVAFI
jgi:co-chaperonin GroES (HSP10)